MNPIMVPYMIHFKEFRLELICFTRRGDLAGGLRKYGRKASGLEGFGFYVFDRV